MKSSSIVGIAVLLLVIVILGLLFSGVVPILQSSAVGYPVALTDPIQVPNGTSSVMLYYSSLQVTLPNGTQSFSLTGSVNLLSLSNLTQILGNVQLPSNVTIKNVILNLTKATITINGTTYPVEIPSTVVFPVNQRLSANNSIVLDVLPSVDPIYGSNQTLYVLIPSGVGTIFRGKITNGEHLPTAVRKDIEDLRANISIVNATLSYLNKETYLRIYVKNTGNESTVLMHVLLRGEFNMAIGRHIIPMNISSIDEEDSRLNQSFGNVENEIENESDPHGRFSLPNGIFNNISEILGVPANVNVSNLSSSTIEHIKDKLSNALERIRKLMREMYKERVINFFVSNNGSLYLPFEGEFKLSGVFGPSSVKNASCAFIPANNRSEEEDGISEIPNCAGTTAFGYILNPGQTVELTFLGNIAIGGGLISLVPANGTTVAYHLFVQGTRDAHANSTIILSEP